MSVALAKRRDLFGLPAVEVVHSPRLPSALTSFSVPLLPEGQIRVFYHDRFLCRAVCQELAGETVALREIVNARNGRRRQLRHTLQERRRVVDSLLEAKRSTPATQESSSPPSEPTPPPVKLKRYFCDE